MKKVKVKEYENDWAKTIDERRIHISSAESGKQGYYCLGCDEEMQAVKPKKKIQSYFRHDATNINREKAECVLASRTYREKIARDYFFRTKQISLPSIYKYPPKSQDGQPNVLKESTKLFGAKVKSELTFYEDVHGEIKYGKNPEIEDRYNLIRPDIAFFDDADEPILLIELVVNHKVDDEKKDKIRRLGIDCVQVIIPRKDTLDIEKYLAKSSSYKWLYNEIEANTSYIPVLRTDSEELPPIDEQQRKIFEESLSCRKSQIGNLVRAIGRSLKAESYRGIERHFRSEISRIEEGTVQAKSRLGEMEREAEAAVSRLFEERIEGYRSTKIQEERDLKAEEEKHSDLERRYLKKRDLLIDHINKERRIVETFEREQEDIQGYIETDQSEESIRDEIARRRESTLGPIERFIEQERIRSDDLRERKIQQETEIRSSFEKEQRPISKKTELVESSLREIREDTEQIERNIEDIESKIRRLDESGSSRYQRLQEQIAHRIDKRDTKGDDELSKRISSILQLRRLCRDFEDRRALEQELRRSKET